jgi:hypothetical protein
LGLPPRCTIVAVDTFAGSPESTRHGEAKLPGNPVRQAFDATVRRIRELRPDLVVRLEERESVKVACMFGRGELAACFIDGSHASMAVRADIKAWGPKVAARGLLAGHDFDMASVADAVRAQPWAHVRGPGSIWLRA